MTLESRRWPAPAKLNLFLHVTGRRADGYHLLQTVFQLVDLTDDVEIEPRTDGVLRRGAGGWAEVAEADDLTLRAARLLQPLAAPGCGAIITVHKRIPAGGGLGGGSSDAATVLRVLDRLWGLDLGEERLAALGLSLGADVPVFVRGRSAFAEGIGERLSPVALGPRQYLIIDPGVAVATGPVFQAPELTRDAPPTTIARFLAGEVTRNLLEPVVRARHPGVAQALDWLGAWAPARLSGSGGCVFAAFADARSAEAVARRVPSCWRAFVVRGLDESPLHRALEA